MLDHTARASTGVVANEVVVPLLPCVDDEATLTFWSSLGFAVTWQQRRPYPTSRSPGAASLCTTPKRQRRSIPPTKSPADAWSWSITSLRTTPRSSKRCGRHTERCSPLGGRASPGYRTGASRFSIVDPNGNTVIVIQRDEPQELEYGGTATLIGLAKAIDNARILKEFKNDDLAASRALRSGLKRHGLTASTVEQAIALAVLVEVSLSLGDAEAAQQHGEALAAVDHDDASRAAARAVVANYSHIDPYLR